MYQYYDVSFLIHGLVNKPVSFYLIQVKYIRLKCVQTKIGSYGLSECDTDAKCAILRQGKRDWIRTFMKKQLDNENPLFCPTE